MSTEYLVVLPVESIRRDLEYRDSLPLHCTVMPWFRLKEDVRYVALSNFLLHAACGVNALELVSDRPELFGPHNDVAVHVLKHNAQLNQLHTRLLIFLAGIESLPNRELWRFVGADYRPHVSDAGGRSFSSDSRYAPKHLVLIKRENGIKQVVQAYELGDLVPF